MPSHRFKVGQKVLVSSDLPGALKPQGLHHIVRLMPLSDRDPQYVVHSVRDGYDRLVLESQICLPKEPPPADQLPSREQAIPRARSPRDGRTRRTGGGARSKFSGWGPAMTKAGLGNNNNSTFSGILKSI